MQLNVDTLYTYAALRTDPENPSLSARVPYAAFVGAVGAVVRQLSVHTLTILYCLPAAGT